MSHRQVKAVGRRAKWAAQFKVPGLKGSALRVAVTIGDRYFRTIDKFIVRMRREVEREVKALFLEFSADADGWAMDASFASQARILMNALRNKFTKMFADMATRAAQQMTEEVDKNSSATLGSSLREMSGQLELKTDILNDDLRDILTATITENVALIKRVPEKYLDNIQGAVMRSIQTGNGLADLVPHLDKYGVEVRNWSKNVALDQTRKAYNGINKGRMEALGVKKFQWVHSGGSNHPRAFHRDELDGKIFEFADLPVIDKRTGERGIPGQLPYCRCTMRPVWEFDDD